MEIFFDNEIEDRVKFDFDHIQVANDVCKGVLDYLECPFECEINILLTDNDSIRIINNDTRNIDKETDVLSFPNLYYESPGCFEILEEDMADYIDPEYGLVVLGDIILSYDRILSQAMDYGHSVRREYAFLITHSMLHLCGYDHMVEDEAKVMEDLQNTILNKLGITRD